MDAVEYLKALHRMCIKNDGCNTCRVYQRTGEACRLPYISDGEPEERVKIVEEWAKEHPVRTRQSRFLKEFPNVLRTKKGTIGICPQYVDQDIKCGESGCERCKLEYWSEEIPDE